jgi:hypothetical protein
VYYYLLIQALAILSGYFLSHECHRSEISVGKPSVGYGPMRSRSRFPGATVPRCQTCLCYIGGGVANMLAHLGLILERLVLISGVTCNADVHGHPAATYEKG